MNAIPSLEQICWCVPIASLAGAAAAALIAFHRSSRVRALAHWPAILGVALACVLSIWAAGQVLRLDDSSALVTGYSFVFVGDLKVQLSLYLDSLSAVMIVLVNTVGLLILIYSVGYMHGDVGYARYFAVMALFIFSMTMLVLAENYLSLYIFWEGVGLCSYLLIGHWYEKPRASQAARKAFLVNRVGDMALLLGILTLWNEMGHLRYPYLYSFAQQLSPERATVICLLLVGGACAKSAQFPLHIWLPDAMEGPTPVSALIHAATMVTAGVYLVARSGFLFVLSPLALTIVLVVGLVTALLGACIAATEYDLKRVLAYSTISQLGLMFASLGAAAYNRALMPLAAGAALFHLVTHGFFKALLFLAAGNVMHATSGLIDMRMLGNLRRHLPYTHLIFAIGGLALAAIPPFAGFYSKDAILEVLVSASNMSSEGSRPWVAAVFLLVGGLTAFYIGRAYFLTFWTNERLPNEVAAHIHKPGLVMLGPVSLLALGSVVIGGVLEYRGFFDYYIHLSSPFGESKEVGHTGGMGPWIAASVLIAGGGVGLAWWRYVWSEGYVGKIPQGLGGVYSLSAAKFFIDEIYALLIVKPAEMLATVSGWIDRVVDGVVDLVGWCMWLLGRLFRPMQNGQVQFYALAILLGLAIFCLVLISRWGG